MKRSMVQGRSSKKRFDISVAPSSSTGKKKETGLLSSSSAKVVSLTIPGGEGVDEETKIAHSGDTPPRGVSFEYDSSVDTFVHNSVQSTQDKNPKEQAKMDMQYFDAYTWNPKDNPSIDLAIDYSLCLHHIDEVMLSKFIGSAKSVSLKIKGALQFPPLAVLLIQQYISPKLEEIVINDCHNITWNDIKPILASADAVERIDFRRNNWMNDYVMEQLSIKFNKNLKAIKLERCEVSDNSMNYVARKCTNLRQIVFDCCHKITSLGIKELSKRVHLNHIEISHNIMIGDKGVESLIMTAGNLRYLTLSNCPGVTDKVINALYEAEVAWGKKRNTKSLGLTELNINGNPNFTWQIMTMLSTANPELQSLDVLECTNIDVNKAIHELETLKKIKGLKFGPSSKPVNVDELLQSLFFHCENLTTLHMNKIKEINDSEIAEILEECPNLLDLALLEINTGVLAIEAAASTCPELQKLALTGSTALTDSAMRCITSVCLNLTSIRVNNCPGLTDDGFARAIMLRFVEHLDLSQNPQFNGECVSQFPLAPLKTLILDGLESIDVSYLNKCSARNQKCMQTVSFRDCKVIEKDDVASILNRFLFCRSFDFTGCAKVEAELATLQHFNPFVEFCGSGGFYGFKLTAENEHVMAGYQSLQQHFQRHRITRVIQKLHSKLVKKRKERAMEIAKMRYEKRVNAASRLCAFVRGWQVRNTTDKWLYAGRIITRLGRRHVRSVWYRKSVKARKHYVNKCRRMIVRTLAEVAARSKAKLMARAEKLYPKLYRRLKRTTMENMKEMEDESIQNRLSKQSKVMWEINIKVACMDSWKKLRSGLSIARRKQLLCKILLTCIPTNYHNSRRQIANLQASDHFGYRRVVITGWVAMMADYLRTKMAQEQEPVAEKYFENTFFFRVVKATFNAMHKYRTDKKYKRKVLEVGEKYFHFDIRRKLLFRFWCKRFRKQTQREGIEKGKTNAANFLVRVAIEGRFRPNIRIARTQKRVNALWKKFIVQFNTIKGYERYRAGLVWSRKWRNMVAQAAHKFLLTIGAKVWVGWLDYNALSKDAERFVIDRYHEKWMRKIYDVLKRDWEKNKKYLDSVMEKEGEQEVISEEEKAKKLAHTMKCVAVVQAHIRGYQWRAKWIEIFVTKNSAIQLMQRFIRRGLAYRAARRRRRMRAAVLFIGEEKELDLMRKAEKEMIFYNYIMNAILTMQRVFRGWKGREEGKLLAVEYARSRGIIHYENIAAIREKYYQARGVEADKKKKQMDHGAIGFQRLWRGVLGRRIYRDRRAEVHAKGAAVLLQTLYRRRLAMFKLLALKREAAINMRFRAARRQRANYFKFFGMNKRKSLLLQAIAVFLDRTGFDPISFNYRPMELIRETIEDFKTFKKDCIREWNIFKKTKGDFLQSIKERREILKNEGWEYNVYDTVKIIDLAHEYRGRTGVISRIDKSIPGQPLLEIKLDHIPKVTFVMMTTDALQIYSNKQPLARTGKNPKLGNYIAMRQAPIYGLNKDNPLFDGKNIDAAWTIQRAYRSYRAYKIAARVRYEVWSRASNVHKSWVTTLANTGTLTDHTNTLSRLLRLKAEKTIFYDEIRHNFDSFRLADSKKIKVKELVAIRKESEESIRERSRYMEYMHLKKNEFFAVGVERITNWRKAKILYRMIKGSGGGIKDIFGSKGINFLRGKIDEDKLIKGTDRFFFKQFENSPYVRYPKLSVYQGSWTGIPFFTELKPHGKGHLVFLDGWGFADETKVLYLEICKCRYLNAMDLDTSDPYCDIFCNGRNVQTSIKWKNLNPDFYEHFEIDVTNESANVTIVVKDKDIFGEDDFMGQVVVPIKQFKDGKVHELTQNLLGEDITIDEGFDRGEITFRCRWTVRAFEDDIRLKFEKQRKATIIQAWARRIAAQEERKRLLKQHKKLYAVVIEKAIVMQSVVRMRLGRLVYKKKRKELRSCIKIQTRYRMILAARELASRMVFKHAAVKIQKIMRGKLARLYVSNIVERRLKVLTRNHTIIQTWIRRYLAQCRYEDYLLDKAENPERDEDGDIIKPPPVSEWIHTYGYDEDPDYRLKRNRRLVHNAFYRALNKKYMRLQTEKFGPVFVDQYPTERSQEERAEEEDLCDHDDFVSVFLPPVNARYMKKKDVLSLIKEHEFKAAVCISTTIDIKKATYYYLVSLQCMVRNRIAWKKKLKLYACHEAFAKLQRRFRMRSLFLHISTFKIQAFFHMLVARRRCGFRRAEINSAKTIQRGFRCYRARNMICFKRSIQPFDIAILKSSTELKYHGAEKLVDFKEHTFYVAQSKEMAEIRFEFRKVEAISDIWIQTGTYSLTPHRVTIEVLEDKVLKKYLKVVDDFDMFDKGMLWHKFHIEVIQSKYMKITFNDTSSEEDAMSIRQIRFIRAKERSAHILQHPKNHVFNNDPANPLGSVAVGNRKSVELRVAADGWPLPTYQWYVNNRPIAGATKPRINLMLYCKSSHSKRGFRCLKCKLFSKSVPLNAYNVKCGSCGKLFSYKEIHDYEKELKRIHEDEKEVLESRKNLQELLEQMELSEDLEFKSKIGNLKKLIDENEEKILDFQNQRCMIKYSAEYSNRYTKEGVYKCRVRNYRGKSVCIEKWTEPATVVVETPEPYVLKVYPGYTPRPITLRKKWNHYHSIYAYFTKGKVQGIVNILYLDGSRYEGPYIGDEWLDHYGRVDPKGRNSNHYGVYKCNDGRIFEGVLVDNHFDINNLQGYYRVTLTNGSIYDGAYCDEEFHGVGLLTSPDGTEYEGEWHRGQKYGYGHLRHGVAKYAYEGWFSADKRHGEGLCSFQDGSFYIGEWSDDKMTGRGILIATVRDVYKGEFLEGLFHGFGEMIYSNGSKYVGEFKNNRRNGRGIFIERHGAEYYGHFIDDVKHGEHIVKSIMKIEEAGQDCFEIRIGVYDMGNFVTWKLKFSNPILTKNFVKMFDKGAEAYDGVFSMMVAKALPKMPDGVDPNNPDVKRIMDRIRREAGDLIGDHVLKEAIENLEAIMVPIKQKKALLKELQKELDTLGSMMLTIDEERSVLSKKWEFKMLFVDREYMKIQQYWYDDKRELKPKFEYACKQLSSISKDEWFQFKNHRIPPPFTKMCLDACAYLLGELDDWRSEQLIVSDSVTCGRAKLEIGLRFDFGCRLAFMMQDYDIFDAIHKMDQPMVKMMKTKKEVQYDWEQKQEKLRKEKEEFDLKSPAEQLYILENKKKDAEEDETEPNYDDYPERLPTVSEQAESNKAKINKILSDARFKRDSYYIVSIGAGGPLLVDWVRAKVAYMEEARKLVAMRTKADGEKVTAARMKAELNHMAAERERMQKSSERIKEQMAKLQEELIDLQLAMLKAEDMKLFVEESLHMDKVRDLRPDYYTVMEKKIEEKRDRFVVETMLEELKGGVEAIYEKEQTAIKNLCKANNKEYVEEKYEPPNLKEFIKYEIEGSQLACIEYGENMGYATGKETNVITTERVQEIIEYVVRKLIQMLNVGYNADANDRAWLAMDGRTIYARSLYVYCHKVWKTLAIEREQLNDCAAWEEAFGYTVAVNKVVESFYINEQAQAASAAAIAAGGEGALEDASAQVAARAAEKELAVNRQTMAAKLMECAKNAYIAKVAGDRMSKVARVQGKIWANRNPEQVEKAIAVLADEYRGKYSGNPGSKALELIHDNTGAVPPDLKASVFAYTKMYPDEYKEARIREDEMMSTKFVEKHGQEQAKHIAYLILNDLDDIDEKTKASDYNAALQWKNFNQDDYYTHEREEIEKQVALFEEFYQLKEKKENALYYEAALIIESAALSKYVNNHEDLANLSESYGNDNSVILQAKCWGSRNQGMLRKGTEEVAKEFHNLAVRHWHEITDQTDHFRKGSYLYRSEEEIADPSKDKFASFRVMLKMKFDRLHGYLQKTHDDCIQKLENLDHDDPLYKIKHNIRPSEAKKHHRDTEKSFLVIKREVEDKLSDAITKLGMWNTYFGQDDEDDDGQSMNVPPST